jgi:aminoglycoside 3-N-acetyltransferase
MRAWSILTEYLRTWPGAHRSGNPEASMVAVGAKAAWLTADHPLQYGYGLGSPLDKLTQCAGRVLLLGASLDSLTLLHYAEHLARVSNKRVVRYQMPFLRDGQKVWEPVEEFDTTEPPLPGTYTFEEIAHAYMAAHPVANGLVGAAQCYLFEAAPLARFAMAWLEERCGRVAGEK